MAAIVPVAIAVLLAAPALRLLLLAHRTRQTPELWVGLFFLGVAIGIPARLVGANLSATDSLAATSYNGVGHVAFAAGACALFLFVRSVFHPADRWASTLATTGIAVICLTTAVLILGGDVNQERSLAVLAVNLSRVAPILWAFVESARYRGVMKRRAALGMGDPVVANRFLLWSLWTGALGLIPGLAAVLRMVNYSAIWLGLEMQQTAALQQGAVKLLGACLAVAAPVAIAALWLSFFPPKRYLERLAELPAPG